MSCPIQIWDVAILMEQDHSRTFVLLSSGNFIGLRLFYFGGVRRGALHPGRFPIDFFVGGRIPEDCRSVHFAANRLDG